jgi:hypothetical protein
MSTVAEIKAAINQLSPQEQDEVKTYLRQRMAEDWNQPLPGKCHLMLVSGSAKIGVPSDVGQVG